MPEVPAPANTAGMVNTPVPTMLPMTSPVAEVKPREWAFFSLRGDNGGLSGGSDSPEAGGRSVMSVIRFSLRAASEQPGAGGVQARDVS
jgi:hypothetical protein